jgi:hypothetical protein
MNVPSPWQKSRTNVAFENEANGVVKCCGRWSRLVLVFADCAMSLGRVKRYKLRFISAQSAEVLCRKVSTDIRLKVVG